jgi:hypothetical protein
MSPFFARRQYNTPILYIGVQRIASTDIEAAPEWPRKNDLSLRGNFGLHGKTILPSSRRFRNISSSCFYRKFCAAHGGCRAPQPNRGSRGNSDQCGRSNFAQNLKHATSPTVTMSTMLSALKIIIHPGIWLAQRRDLKWHADINKVG